MTENTNVDENDTQQKPPDNNKDQDLVNKLVEERLNEALQPIKEKLDKAYDARDKALKKIAEIEQKEKEENLKRLQEEGKFKEAYEIQLNELNAKTKVLEQRNVELTRDNTVRNTLVGLDFKNEKASDMAFHEITSQLIRDENGNWIHKSGISIKDFVSVYAESEDNAFLFKPKISSGSGGSAPRKGGAPPERKSIFDLSQDEVLKLASEGKLRKK